MGDWTFFQSWAVVGGCFVLLGVFLGIYSLLTKENDFDALWLSLLYAVWPGLAFAAILHYWIIPIPIWYWGIASTVNITENPNLNGTIITILLIGSGFVMYISIPKILSVINQSANKLFTAIDQSTNVLVCQFVFWHKIVGGWKYKNALDCTQFKSCRCGRNRKNGLVLHMYNEWKYLDNNSCEQIRVCERDSNEEKRDAHQFGVWEYIEAKSCKQVGVCARCGKQQEQTSHLIDNWVFITSNSCEQKGSCERCEEQFTRLQHQWIHNYEEGGEPIGEIYKSGGRGIVYSEPVHETYCTRCGEGR